MRFIPAVRPPRSENPLTARIASELGRSLRRARMSWKGWDRSYAALGVKVGTGPKLPGEGCSDDFRKIVRCCAIRFDQGGEPADRFLCLATGHAKQLQEEETALSPKVDCHVFRAS